MIPTRRDFFIAAGATASALVVPGPSIASDRPKKRHIVTLSFDDGFRKSFLRTAEIYEKHKLSACLNVVAAWSLPPFADFKLWNELQNRGHEIMPHGYKHENLRQVSFDEGKNLIRRCLDMFAEKLEGFDPKRAIFNFPYNASTPELEKWLPTQVLAFRTGGAAINPLPHKGQAKLTCTSFGPGNSEAAVNREIEEVARQRLRLADLQHAWTGRRGLGADPSDLLGAASGSAPRHRKRGDSACGEGTGEVRRLTMRVRQ